VRGIRSRWLFSAVIAALGASIAAALATEVPERLPSVALGSPLVLYAERSAAVFAALLLALLVLIRAWNGELPTELSGRGVTYTKSETTADLRDAALEALAELEQAQEVLGERLERLERKA
jgi:hypothetical protein